MAKEIVIPELGESITEVQIASWLKQEGDTVAKDEDLVSVESEKATVEIPAPMAGKLVKIIKSDGEDAKVGDVIAEIDDEGSNSSSDKESDQTQRKKASGPKAASKESRTKDGSKADTEDDHSPKADRKQKPKVMPAARAVLEKHGLKAEEVKAKGPGGRLLKEDVLAYMESKKDEDKTDDTSAESPKKRDSESRSGAVDRGESLSEAGSSSVGMKHQPKSEYRGVREEEVKRLSPLRRTVAKRLLEAQHTMAMLTTFNEIDMSAVSALRRELKDEFQARHGVKLGMMSFFVKAVIAALQEVPQLNAELRGDDLVIHHYHDIGVAIGAGKGLVVPPLRNAGQLSFAEIEQAIADLAARARDNKLSPEELEGGTFTISNGGIYGSLLSTPIINPPQSGILGLHAIQDRPVAIQGEVVIRPIMNVALSYDHRIVDGREAVTFLRRVKEFVESPTRLLLEV